MESGMIKDYFPAEHYGFIIGDDEEEYFFHANDIHPKFRGRRILPEMRVKFDVKSDMKGDKAVNIHF